MTRQPTFREPLLFREPLFRLLAINLAIGIAAALLMTSGLLWLDPFGLRRLVLSDSAGGIAAGLLLAGFVVTLGSTAMGTAIMAIGRNGGPDSQDGQDGQGGGGTPAAVAPALAPARVQARQSARIV